MSFTSKVERLEVCLGSDVDRVKFASKVEVCFGSNVDRGVWAGARMKSFA